MGLDEAQVSRRQREEPNQFLLADLPRKPPQPLQFRLGEHPRSERVQLSVGFCTRTTGTPLGPTGLADRSNARGNPIPVRMPAMTGVEHGSVLVDDYPQDVTSGGTGYIRTCSQLGNGH